PRPSVRCQTRLPAGSYLATVNSWPTSNSFSTPTAITLPWLSMATRAAWPMGLGPGGGSVCPQVKPLPPRAWAARAVCSRMAGRADRSAREQPASDLRRSMEPFPYLEARKYERHLGFVQAAAEFDTPWLPQPERIAGGSRVDPPRRLGAGERFHVGLPEIEL